MPGCRIVTFEVDLLPGSAILSHNRAVQVIPGVFPSHPQDKKQDIL